MKKVLIPLMVLFGLLTAGIAFAAEHPLNESFRGIAWGTPESELVNKYGLEKGKQLIENTYTRAGDNQSMGSIPLQYIHYYTNNDGKFYKVDMRAAINHSGALVQMYQQQFGQETTGSPKEYMWDLGKVKVWIEAKPAPVSSMSPYTLITITRKSEEAMKNQGGGF